MALGLSTDVWKRNMDDYMRSACELCASMAVNGFLPASPIPIDQNKELLGGAHRLACAIALNIPLVSVVQHPRMAWAPPWHHEWFVDHGMSRADLKRLEADWELMKW